MKKRTMYLSMLSALVLALNTTHVGRAVGDETETPRVMIAELSPESKQAASEEYVLLYNPGKETVDVTGWQLQYRSASHTPDDQKSWSIKAILGCKTAEVSTCKIDQLTTTVINGGETLRLASYGSDAATLPFVSGMATIGGQVRLLQPDSGQDGSLLPVVYDLVGYGAAKTYEGTAPAVAPKAGQSIARAQLSDAYQDSDDNAKDFALSQDEDADTSNQTDNPGQGAGGGPYLDAVITEIFPDPVSPQLDSADEFVELYNPYDEPLDLAGYALVTGSTWSHKYIIRDATIDPHNYVAFTSAETHISLSNGGTGVRLLDPNGSVVFEAPSYGKAASGSSWVQAADGRWVWTTSPTPGEANVIVEPISKPSPVAAASSKKATATKATSTKKTATAKVAAAAVTKNPGEGSGTPNVAKNMNYLILAAAGAVAGGYVVFEYRRDIAVYARRAWRALGGWFNKK